MYQVSTSEMNNIASSATTMAIFIEPGLQYVTNISPIILASGNTTVIWSLFLKTPLSFPMYG